MIQSYRLSHGGLCPVPGLEAQVMLFSDPDLAERDLLHSAFKLDAHALASALDPDEVSRIEFHPDYLFLIWKRPENYSGAGSLSFEVSSCGLLFAPERLLVTTRRCTAWAPGTTCTRPRMCCWTCCSTTSITTWGT